MRSPFAIFRKHARVLTVVLTGLAMLAFIVLGSIDQRQFPVVMGIIIGTSLFWYFGARAGRPKEYAVAGAILGGILSYVVMDRVTQRNPAVVTSIGSLSQQQLSSLIQKRQVANRFLTEAYYRSNDQQSFMPPPRFGFRTPSNRAPTSKELEEDVVLGYLLQHEADQLDIVVSDDAVNEFINRLTNDKLSRAAFNDVRGQMRMSRSQLFDVLRDELKARIAL